MLATQSVMFVFKGESCDNWEIWLYIWGELGSMDHISVVKYVKAGFNVITDDSVG